MGFFSRSKSPAARGTSPKGSGAASSSTPAPPPPGRPVASPLTSSRRRVAGRKQCSRAVRPTPRRRRQGRRLFTTNRNSGRRARTPLPTSSSAAEAGVDAVARARHRRSRDDRPASSLSASAPTAHSGQPSAATISRATIRSRSRRWTPTLQYRRAEGDEFVAVAGISVRGDYNKLAVAQAAEAQRSYPDRNPAPRRRQRSAAPPAGRR